VAWGVWAACTAAACTEVACIEAATEVQMSLFVREDALVDGVLVAARTALSKLRCQTSALQLHSAPRFRDPRVILADQNPTDQNVCVVLVEEVAIPSSRQAS